MTVASLGDIFGKGSIGEQLFVWGLLNQVVAALTSPAMIELQQLMLSTNTNNVLSPAELAQLVNRGFIDANHAAAEGAKSGVNPERMGYLTDLAGQAPGPAELVEGLRRGLIAEDASINGLPSFVDGIRQGNLRDVWAPFMKALAVQLPSWSDALDALLEGQLDEATAKEWFVKAGGDLDAFQWLFDTRGSAPTPVQAAEMANRGIIAWDGAGPESTSFHQAFLEGPWRNKWEQPFRDNAEYRVPARSVPALLKSGAIDSARALQMLRANGLSAADAAAFIKEAEAAHHGAAKNLTRADIAELYTGHLITAAQASDMLTKLGYTAQSAALLVSGVDLRRTIANTNSAVTKVRTLYVGHRLDKPATIASLEHLGMSREQANLLMATWDVEHSATVRLLTPAQIASAWGLGIMDQATAQAELVAQGYTAFDAWVVLSIHNKAALPDRPAQ